MLSENIKKEINKIVKRESNKQKSKNVNSLLQTWGFKKSKTVSDDLEGRNQEVHDRFMKGFLESRDNFDIKGYVCPDCKSLIKDLPLRFALHDFYRPGVCGCRFYPMFLCEKCNKEFIGHVFAYSEKEILCDDEEIGDLIKFEEYRNNKNK